MTGTIPAELGNLSSLRKLWLSRNGLTGPIPAELGSLPNLERLSLGGNQLTGTIPPELGSLTNLTELRLNHNQLTGTIPSSLGNLTNLQVIGIAGNRLTGCVPSALRDVEYNDFAQLGLPFCGTPASYDSNGNGIIELPELFDAIDDYFAGKISLTVLFDIIDFYFSGPGDFASVSAGFHHTCGVRTDGSVSCWGANGMPPRPRSPCRQEVSSPRSARGLDTPVGSGPTGPRPAGAMTASDGPRRLRIGSPW